MEAILDFVNGNSFWVYLLICIAEAFYTAICVIRVIVLNRGNRIVASGLALVEILLWVAITGTVLTNLLTNPLKVFAYGLGFALGTYLGACLEARLALGFISLSIFLPDTDCIALVTDLLSKNGYGATMIDATGLQHTSRKVLMVVAKRKNEKSVVDLIHSVTNKAVITVSAVTSIEGGYVKGRGHRKPLTISHLPRVF